MAHLISFGAIHKITGEYVYPKIANKQDEYICPECNKDLILCQGNIRVHHFRHKVDALNPCHHYSHPSESDVHKEAKILLKNLLERRIPISFVRTCCSCKDDEVLNMPKFNSSSQIKLEHRFNHDGNLKIADVAHIKRELCISLKDLGTRYKSCMVANKFEFIDRLVCFEIFNTHKTATSDRPEPWFEINATTLIALANNTELASLRIPCVRADKCDKCITIEKSDFATYNIAKDVRLKLGQTLFPMFPWTMFSEYECDKNGYWYKDNRRAHLRFDFDARDDVIAIQDNKRICELFKDDNYRLTIHTHKGGRDVFVVLNSPEMHSTNSSDEKTCPIPIINRNYLDYWDKDNLDYRNPRLPFEHKFDDNDWGTVEIIVEYIKFCKHPISIIKNIIRMERKPQRLIEFNRELNDAITTNKKAWFITGCNEEIHRMREFNYFNVPYAKKDEAKQLGFKWDNNHKKWYINASHTNYETACNLYTKFIIPVKLPVSAPIMTINIKRKTTTDA